MGHPLLDLDQEWHRQRAQLRATHRRPPPLVTAGIDLAYDATSASHQRVRLAGMALVFGIFPATLDEFIELARTRLRLGNASGRSELEGVLGARIQSLWAWLPTLQQDCYLELDHATEMPRVWLVGPGAGASSEIDPNEEHADLDRAFLAALVINGSRHWGGREGLARLVQRFGRLPLLIAAQVAEALERAPQEVEAALALAHARWPQLTAWDETHWEPLVDDEAPWVCVQLGRLALRLGLLRAGRLLLGQCRHADVPPVAWYDLGQACEALVDLAGATEAYGQYTTANGEDADGWRRLLVCRLRSGLFWEAEAAFKRYRAADGSDRGLVERLVTALRRPGLPLIQRANCAGWLCARTTAAATIHLPMPDLLTDIVAHLRHVHPDLQGDLGAALAAQVERLRRALRALLVHPPVDDAQPMEGDGSNASGLVEAAVRVALLALPLLADAPPGSQASHCAAHGLLALRNWGELAIGRGQPLDSTGVRACLLDMSHIALGDGRG